MDFEKEDDDIILLLLLTSGVTLFYCSSAKVIKVTLS